MVDQTTSWLRFNSTTPRLDADVRPDYADEFGLTSNQLSLIRRMFLFLRSGNSLQRTIASAVAARHVEDWDGAYYRDDVLAYASEQLFTTLQLERYRTAVSTSLFTTEHGASSIRMMVQDIRIVLMGALIAGNTDAVNEISHLDVFEFVANPVEADRMSVMLWKYVESDCQIPFTWWYQVSDGENTIKTEAGQS